MADKLKLPDNLIPVDNDEIASKISKEFDLSLIKPIKHNFDFEAFGENTRKQIDNLDTYKDRVNYANKVFNKGSFHRDLLIAVFGGIILLAIEHWRDIWNFITNLINVLK